MAVSKRLRFEILRRDNHTCRYCGATGPTAPLRIDHVIPVALGGSDAPDNLVTSCEPCNSGKSSASPDATHVAAVSDDAIRWATAMQKAAENLRQQQAPKDEYRTAFLAEWNRWGRGEGEARTTVELPADWKASLERFRVAGLPAEVWGDIVDTAMGYEKVLRANKFKYCCGIAWNMVTELQAEAQRIVGVRHAPVVTDVRAAVLETAFTVWFGGLSDDEAHPSAEQEEEFRRSLAGLSDWDLTQPGRIIEAAQHATYFRLSSITEALKDLDREHVWNAWISAWPKTYVPGETDDPWSGRYIGGPSDEAMERVKGKIAKLVDSELHVSRLVQAASYAGFHGSTRIYRGLPDEESGEHTGLARSLELWRVAFTAAGDREPSPDEIAQFASCLQRAGTDGGFALEDIYGAATAAGAYQDADLSTCLLRQQSVFEAAARPLAQSV